jgi:hypothetical protein
VPPGDPANAVSSNGMVVNTADDQVVDGGAVFEHLGASSKVLIDAHHPCVTMPAGNRGRTSSQRRSIWTRIDSVVGPGGIASTRC